MFTRINKKKVATVLAISGLALLTGCGSSSNNGSVSGVPGAVVGAGGCIPITSLASNMAIGFTATGMYAGNPQSGDMRVLAGQIPYGDQDTSGAGGTFRPSRHQWRHGSHHSHRNSWNALGSDGGRHQPRDERDLHGYGHSNGVSVLQSVLRNPLWHRQCDRICLTELLGSEHPPGSRLRQLRLVRPLPDAWSGSVYLGCDDG